MELRRHNLVWLDPAQDAASWAGDAEQAPFVRDWVGRGWPLVVAMQPGALSSDALALGFTAPPPARRQRVCLRVPPSAIHRHARPLALAAAIRHAPTGWQPTMAALEACCAAHRVDARVYGSLSAQALTGLPCVAASSDLDVLFDCGADVDAAAFLAALQALPPGGVRIDGELRLANGWAVPWREAAAALQAGGAARLLAKSDSAAGLLTSEEFFGRVADTIS